MFHLINVMEIQSYCFHNKNYKEMNVTKWYLYAYNNKFLLHTYSDVTGWELGPCVSTFHF